MNRKRSRCPGRASDECMKISIGPVPGGLAKAKDPLRHRSQGDEPHRAAAEGVVISSDWQLFAEGAEVPVYAVPVTRGGPHSFASFDYADDAYAPVVVTAVPIGRTAGTVRIAPKSAGAEAEIRDGGIRFTVTHPVHLTITVNDGIEQPLTLSVNPPQKNIPLRTDPGVLYFGAGIHHADYFDLVSGMTVYLEPGALVIADPPKDDEKVLVEKDWAGAKIYRNFMIADQAETIRLCGRGIIDTSYLEWHHRAPLRFSRCSRISVEGITFTGAGSWTLTLSQCSHAEIDNIKMFSYRENSDGIDIVSSTDVTVRNCMIRTGDDAICLKAMSGPPVCGGEDVLVEKCVLWNDKVRCLGICCETRNDISRVIFRDCDVIRSYADWTRELGSLCIVVCDQASIHDILFEDIRIEHEVHYATTLMIVKDFWSKDPEAGHIRNITFRNITVDSPVKSYVAGYDPDHRTEDIMYENLTVMGEKAASFDSRHFEWNDFIGNVTVR